MRTSPLLELHEAFCQEALMLNYRPATIRWWRTGLKTFLSYFAGHDLSDVRDLTPAKLREYFYAKRSSSWTPDTFSSQYRSLRAFFKWCLKEGHLDADPLAGLQRPRLNRKLPKSISKSDAQVVLDYVFHGPHGNRFQRYRNRAALAIMVYAGLRANEVLYPFSEPRSDGMIGHRLSQNSCPPERSGVIVSARGGRVAKRRTSIAAMLASTRTP